MADQAFITLGTMLAWLAVAMAGFAMLSDWALQRLRKRRRCPKCWYDLSHTQGLRCSECGHVAHRERSLFKARRRWRVVCLALLLALGAYALRVTPAIKQRGWVAAVPTTAIIAALRWIEPPDELWQFTNPVAKPATVGEALAVDLLEQRIEDQKLWNWQKTWLASRSLRGDSQRRPPTAEWSRLYGEILDKLHSPYSGDRPWWFEEARNLIDVEIRTRPKWPRGVPVYAQVSIRRWNDKVDHFFTGTPLTANAKPINDYAHSIWTRVSRPMRWGDDLTHIGTFAELIDYIEYDVYIEEVDRNFDTGANTRVPLRSYRMQVPIQIVDDPLTGLVPTVDPELTDALTAVLHPSMTVDQTPDQRTRAGLDLWGWDREGKDYEPWKVLRGTTLGLRMSIQRNGIEIGDCETWCGFDGQQPEWVFPWPTGDIVEFNWAEGEPRPVDLDAWTITIKGDAALALRNFDCDRYWAGEIKLPLEIVVRESRSWASPR